MPARRVSLAGAMVLIALIGLALAFVLNNEPQRFQRASQRMSVSLRSLSDSSPPDVPPLVWKNAVETTWNVTGNVFVLKRVSVDEINRFIAELEHELQGEVGLETLDWIGRRLARTPVKPGRRAHVRDFIARYRQTDEFVIQGQRTRPPGGGKAQAATGGTPGPGARTESSEAQPKAGESQ